MLTKASRTAELHMDQRISYYAAGFGACAMGLACFNTTLSSVWFTTAAIVLAGAGFVISWNMRAGTLAAPKVETGLLAGLLCLLAAVFAVPGFRNQVLPVEAMGSTDMLMGVLLIWLTVACSYRLNNDRSVLFMCVPGLSLIGLTATFDPNTEVLTFFGIFLTLACFVLIRQNTFSYQEQAGQADGAVRLSAGSVKLHIGITASVTLAAMVIGIALGTLLYPRLVNTLTRQVAPFDAPQLVDQLVGEEYVPIATGPVDLSNQELMTVRCDRPLLWRGRTYNTYTGQGWTSDLTWDEQVWVNPVETPRKPGKSDLITTFVIPRHPLYETSRSSERVEQVFSITSGPYKTVFAAAQPRIIKFNIPEYTLRYGSRIETGAGFGPRTVYTVVSRVSNATVRQLANAPTRYPARIRERYLNVPETCWEVQTLTEDITRGLPNPYRKALAIQSFLEQNFVYDTTAPRAPEHEDAVTYFLLRSKRGYCDIFASSMVIMARQAGIPARWVTGFASGELRPEDGVYHVLAKDRHAWAELYFPGYGWIEFDATPSAVRVHWWTRLRDIWAMVSSDKPTMIVLVTVLFLFGYLIKVEIIDRLRRRGRRTPTPQEVYAAEISRNYRRMCSVLARAGYPRHPTATPWEYAKKLEPLFGENLAELHTAVDAITADFVEFRYSPREPSQDRLAAMSRAVQDLGRSLNAARKRNLLPQNRLA